MSFSQQTSDKSQRDDPLPQLPLAGTAKAALNMLEKVVGHPHLGLDSAAGPLRSFTRPRSSGQRLTKCVRWLGILALHTTSSATSLIMEADAGCICLLPSLMRLRMAATRNPLPLRPPLSSIPRGLPVRCSPRRQWWRLVAVQGWYKWSNYTRHLKALPHQRRRLLPLVLRGDHLHRGNRR